MNSYAKKYSRTEIISFVSSFLEYVDDLIYTGKEPEPTEADYYDIIIIGGSVFLYEETTARSKTGDIDVYSYYLPKLAQQNMYKFLMNTRSQAYSYAMPYNYEDRLEILEQSDYGIAYRASWEDIAFAKLQRNDYDDIIDLTTLASKEELDWNQLNYIITDSEEALGSGMPRHRYDELLSSYNSFLNQMGQPTLSRRQIETLLDNAG